MDTVALILITHGQILLVALDTPDGNPIILDQDLAPLGLEYTESFSSRAAAQRFFDIDADLLFDAHASVAAS